MTATSTSEALATRSHGPAKQVMARHPAASRFAPLISLILFILVWQLLSLRYPPFILPGPASVAERIVEKLADGSLIVHIATTLSEAIPGLILGALAAFALGVPIAKSPLADRLLSPFIVASQGIPFIAVAPLLFIWFGSGLGAKILVCALIVFFPIVINVIAGLRSTPPVLRDLFRSLGATPAETFFKLELPAALPFIFAGLRVGGTLSMIGAITGEFLSADRGLGFMINLGNGLYDTALVIAGVLTIVLIALGIYSAIRLAERALRVERWAT
ncbi:MAG: ABC transporter permease [Anaerolineae bacterium]|nr:ABC transporter permease [Candidatus Roseilinea sp.]MDW8450716.1 ABC transporter permease [Anaerolineae bacterium]